MSIYINISYIYIYKNDYICSIIFVIKSFDYSCTKKVEKIRVDFVYLGLEKSKRRWCGLFFCS